VVCPDLDASGAIPRRVPGTGRRRAGKPVGAGPSPSTRPVPPVSPRVREPPGSSLGAPRRSARYPAAGAPQPGRSLTVPASTPDPSGTPWSGTGGLSGRAAARGTGRWVCGRFRAGRGDDALEDDGRAPAPAAVSSVGAGHLTLRADAPYVEVPGTDRANAGGGSGNLAALAIRKEPEPADGRPIRSVLPGVARGRACSRQCWCNASTTPGR